MNTRLVSNHSDGSACVGCRYAKSVPYMYKRAEVLEILVMEQWFMSRRIGVIIEQFGSFSKL